MWDQPGNPIPANDVPNGSYRGRCLKLLRLTVLALSKEVRHATGLETI